jgi:hypothetical protein
VGSLLTRGIGLIVLMVGACSTPSPATGTERGPCYGNGTCNAGLTCASDVCVSLAGDAGLDDANPAEPDAATMGCDGVFGSPVPVLMMAGALSPAVTADELELFYTVGSHYFVATRSSASGVFFQSRALNELDAACPVSTGLRSIDVSNDGLRVYLGCNDSGGALVTAHRTARTSTATFIADGTMTGGFYEPAVVMNEFALYDRGPTWAARTDIGAAFPQRMPIPNFTTMLEAPDVSPDGLTLYGHAMTPGGFSILAYTRSSTGVDFDPNSVTMLPNPTGQSLAASPEISASCRTLYVAAGGSSGLVGIFASHR